MKKGVGSIWHSCRSGCRRNSSSREVHHAKSKSTVRAGLPAPVTRSYSLGWWIFFLKINFDNPDLYHEPVLNYLIISGSSWVFTSERQECGWRQFGAFGKWMGRERWRRSEKTEHSFSISKSFPVVLIPPWVTYRSTTDFGTWGQHLGLAQMPGSALSLKADFAGECLETQKYTR